MNAKQMEIDFNTPPELLSYESAYIQLEQIVAVLESEEHTLDQTLALFERGQILLQHCITVLNKAEIRVQQIMDDTIIERNMEE